MIIHLHKVLIYGAKEDMDRFFALAQRAGFLEFIGIWHKKALELPEHVKNFLSAIRIVRNRVGVVEASYEWVVESDPVRFAKQVVDLNHSLERLFEERRLLNAEIARISPFGPFSKEDLVAIEKEGKRVIQFFCRKSNLAHELELPPEVIFVGTEYDLDYYISVSKERLQMSKMIEIAIDKPVQELRELLREVTHEINLVEKQLRVAATQMELLQEGLIDALNEHHLRAAQHDVTFPLSNALFAIEAYVPENHLKGLYGLLSSLTVFVEEIEIEPGERIPTCMENRGMGKIGEDLVNIYDVPAVTDLDPSTWMLSFFSIFFAIIIADAGYGLLFLFTGLFLGRKFRAVGGIKKRMIRLLQIVGVTTTVWGILTASFFGIEVSPNSPFRKYSLLYFLATQKAEYLMREKGELYEHYIQEFPLIKEAQNGHELLLAASLQRDGKIEYVAGQQFADDVLLEFALLLGMIHLAVGMARYARRNIAGIGWISFMIGGYFFLPTSLLDATSIFHFMGWMSKEWAHQVGMILLEGGFGFAIVAAMVQRGILSGIMEPLHAIQVFGDVLSYLRLYALGLAGVIVASTFNTLGLKFGFIIGMFIILAGHALNVSLSMMAGVVHGLRLNFLEWYHYCFVGGGKRFNPLKLHRRE
jgi:V/A-type H+/Na+-transporting ATPase subunit I